MRAAVCDYGAGNVRSVIAALERLEVTCSSSSDPHAIEGADLAVLPGVGAARTAMHRLRSSGLAEALQKRARAGKPTLGICLGLQIALEHTEEDGGVAGLGLAPGRALKLRAGRVPRIGWAAVEPYGSAFYFAHSYAADSPAGVATSEGIVAEVRAGSFVGVQFHPEKSGPAGARYLEDYLRAWCGCRCDV